MKMFLFLKASVSDMLVCVKSSILHPNASLVVLLAFLSRKTCNKTFIISLKKLERIMARYLLYFSPKQKTIPGRYDIIILIFSTGYNRTNPTNLGTAGQQNYFLYIQRKKSHDFFYVNISGFSLGLNMSTKKTC